MAGTNGNGLRTGISEPSEAELNSIRQRVYEMSDFELLRGGVIANSPFSSGHDEGYSEAEVLAAELEEMRAEWKRRFPGLPLRESF